MVFLLTPPPPQEVQGHTGLSQGQSLRNYGWSQYRGYKSFARKCEKTVHPVTTADRRYTLYLKPPLESVLSTSARHNSKTSELLAEPYHASNSTCCLCKNVGIINESSLFIYYKNGRYLKRGSLSNVNSMGDCDGATQYARRRSFPVTAWPPSWMCHSDRTDGWSRVGLP